MTVSITYYPGKSQCDKGKTIISDKDEYSHMEAVKLLWKLLSKVIFS